MTELGVVHPHTTSAIALTAAGFSATSEDFFDTFVVDVSSKGMTASAVADAAAAAGSNVRIIDDNTVGIR